ncbi:hypothetical protein Tco_0967348 [Tanacetum coccineum]
MLDNTRNWMGSTTVAYYANDVFALSIRNSCWLCGATMGRTYYSLHHPTSTIPYLRFTKIIISHYMTNFPEISRRARDIYHNQKDDHRHEDRVGMKIPDWVISDEIKHTEHYRMYAEEFRIDVPLIREFKCSKMFYCDLFLYSSKDPPLTPPALVPNDDKRDEMILQDTYKLSLVSLKVAKSKKLEINELQGRYGYLFEHLKAKFLSRKSFDTLANYLQEVKVQVPVYVAKGLLLERQQNKEETNKIIAKAMLQERGRLQDEIPS